MDELYWLYYNEPENDDDDYDADDYDADNEFFGVMAIGRYTPAHMW